MIIETEYNIGQHVIYAYLNEQIMEIELFDDYIGWISLPPTSDTSVELEYGLLNSCNDCKESELVLYDDEEGLLERIQDLFYKMHRMEGIEEDEEP